MNTTGSEAESGESAAPQREDAEVDPGDSSNEQAMSDADDLATEERSAAQALDPDHVASATDTPRDEDDEAGSHNSGQRGSAAHAFERYDCATGEASQLFRAADAARRAIEQGQCIVLPTDTVYGIAADAFSPEAVQRLLDAKGRGRDMPPPVLIAEPSLIRVLAVDVPDGAKALIDRHWPGALTVIVQAQPSLRLDIGDAEGTIGLRVPDHDLTREILRQTGPMAVSSANRSGEPAALTCDEAVDQLGDSVSVYLDGGRLGNADGLPSTMVDFSQNDAGAVLRYGAITVEELRETCPDLEDLVAPAAPEPTPELTEPEPTEAAVTEPEPTDGALAPGTPDRDLTRPGDSSVEEPEPEDEEPFVAEPGGSHALPDSDTTGSLRPSGA